MLSSWSSTKNPVREVSKVIMVDREFLLVELENTAITAIVTPSTTAEAHHPIYTQYTQGSSSWNKFKNDSCYFPTYLTADQLDARYSSNLDSKPRLNWTLWIGKRLFEDRSSLLHHLLNCPVTTNHLPH
jgi:hypothetical protein